MAATQQLVVDVFRDRAQAEQAVNELLQAGFDHQQIRFAGPEIPAGGMLEKIKNVFAGQDTSASGVYNELVKLGVPLEDARYYQTEFEAGHPVVAVMGIGRMQEAITILAHHGGHSANQRFTQSTGHSPGADVQVPTVGEVNTEYNHGHLQLRGSRIMQQSQQTNTSNTYYDLVSVLYHALEAEQSSATYVQDAQRSGNQDLVQFFSEVQHNASRQVDRAKQLLSHTSSDARSFGSNQWEENRSPARTAGLPPS